MLTNRTILFIDDEKYLLNYYIEAVEGAGYKAVFCSSADEGLAYIRDRHAEIDLIVLDIMMPTPKGAAASETNDGLDTGIWLLQQARELIEEATIPVIVLSNRSKVTLESLVAERILLPDGLVLVATKTETAASALPNLVGRMYQRWKN